MHHNLLLVLAFFASFLLGTAPSTASADQDLSAVDQTTDFLDSGKNCLNQSKPRAVMHSLLGIKYGDIGIEHRLRVGGCTPLGKKRGLLFDRAFFEAGYQQHFSPIYIMPGGYVVVAPLSFLVFNFEAAAVAYWPLGIPAAAYYPLDSYDSDYSRAALPAEEGGNALGWYVRGGVTLQLAVDIGPARLIVLDSVQLEHWVIGEAEHYFHNRNDLPASNPESFIDNNAIVMVEFPVHPNAQLRLGVNDQFTMNFGAQSKSNVLAGVAMLNLSKLGPHIVNFSPILRIGGRTHHPVRQGDINVILALSFSVDLTKEKAVSSE
jgi:hypothetical protein